MLQPAELKSDAKLTWSAGRGSDVWALFHDPAWATPRAWATRRGHAKIAEMLSAAERAN